MSPSSIRGGFCVQCQLCPPGCQPPTLRTDTAAGYPGWDMLACVTRSLWKSMTLSTGHTIKGQQRKRWSGWSAARDAAVGFTSALTSVTLRFPVGKDPFHVTASNPYWADLWGSRAGFEAVHTVTDLIPAPGFSEQQTILSFQRMWGWQCWLHFTPDVLISHIKAVRCRSTECFVLVCKSWSPGGGSMSVLWLMVGWFDPLLLTGSTGWRQIHILK